MTATRQQSIYLTGDNEAIALQFHAADPAGPTSTAVILCPPFGWEEVGSYRIRREWACRLASAGYPTARLSLPGTGHSEGGPRRSGRLVSWIQAVSATASWLREATAAERVVAIGIGLGGLVAYRAAADGAAIDDLVLWATPTRGRALVRQMKAFSRMEAAEFFAGLKAPEPEREGDLEAGGFLLTIETIRELEGVDLAASPPAQLASRRVLLLGQDGIAVDERLRAALSDAGAEVSVASGEGFAAMTAPPQQATPPLATFARVREWLDAPAPALAGASPDSPRIAVEGSDSALIDVDDGVQVRESEFVVEIGSGRLVGTLTEPVGGQDSELCAVFLNGGAIYRMGPNRMWVEATRRWAARGVPSLRLDMEAIGDSDGDPSSYVEDDGLYAPLFVSHVMAALDALHARGIGERYILAGLCSGAYWSLYATLEHPRAVAALMLNSYTLVWDRQTQQAGELRRLRTNRLTWDKVKRNLSLRRAARFGIWLLGERRRGSAVDDLIGRIERSGKRVLLVFGEDEPLRTDLELSGRIERLARCETVTIDYVAVRDHTLRPTWAQRQAHAALDRALDAELERPRVASTSGTG